MTVYVSRSSAYVKPREGYQLQRLQRTQLFFHKPFQEGLTGPNRNLHNRMCQRQATGSHEEVDPPADVRRGHDTYDLGTCEQPGGSTLIVVLSVK